MEPIPPSPASPRPTAKPLWDPESIAILSGAGGDALADEISGIIGLPSTSCLRFRANDGESHIQLGANVRERDVFVVQSTCPPINTNLVELALILSACKRASARRVTAIVPYLGYSRQTRKTQSRVPVSAADVAAILEQTCVDSLVTVDVHDAQIAGFYSPRCAFENVSIIPTAARYLTSTHQLIAPVVVAPHASGVERAMTLATALRDLAASGTGAAVAASADADADADADDGSGSASGADAGADAVAEAGADGGAPFERISKYHRQPPHPSSQSSAVPLAMLLPVERRGVKELELTGDVRGRSSIKTVFSVAVRWWQLRCFGSALVRPGGGARCDHRRRHGGHRHHRGARGARADRTRRDACLRRRCPWDLEW